MQKVGQSHTCITGSEANRAGVCVKLTGPVRVLFFLSNRCYKPLSNLEVSRARPNKEPFG